MLCRTGLDWIRHPARLPELCVSRTLFWFRAPRRDCCSVVLLEQRRTLNRTVRAANHLRCALAKPLMHEFSTRRSWPTQQLRETFCEPVAQTTLTSVNGNLEMTRCVKLVSPLAASD